MFTHLSESSRHDSLNFKQKNYENCYLSERNPIVKWYVVFMPRRSRGILFLSFSHSVLLSETLLVTFEQWVLELWYFTWIFPVIRPFHGFHYFLPYDLHLGVWPFFENFNLANNFWSVSVTAFIFHMNIPCDKTFPWVPLLFTLWPWPWSLTHFWKL